MIAIIIGLEYLYWKKYNSIAMARIHHINMEININSWLFFNLLHWIFNNIYYYHIVNLNEKHKNGNIELIILTGKDKYVYLIQLKISINLFSILFFTCWSKVNKVNVNTHGIVMSISSLNCVSALVFWWKMCAWPNVSFDNPNE